MALVAVYCFNLQYVIDASKFTCCIFVLLIHTEVFSFLPKVYSFIPIAVTKLAVPYFFTASGFFLMMGIEKYSLDIAMKRWYERILPKYFIFSIIWIIQRIITLSLEGYSLKVVVRSILHNLVAYPFNSLWYIWASIIAVGILWFFLKHQRLTLAVFVGSFLYVWSLMCGYYYFLFLGTPVKRFIDIYLRVFISARNGFFFGLYFLAIGMKCRQWLREDKVKYRFVSIVSCVGLVLYFYEVYRVTNLPSTGDGASFLSMLLLIPALFLLTAHPIYVKERRHKVFLFLRYLSVGIYFIHRPLLWFFDLIPWNITNVESFILVMIISVCICSFSYRLKNHFLSHLLR